MAGKIQVYVTRDDLPEGFYNEQFKKWDLGTSSASKAPLFRTNTGELSVHVGEIRLLTKALRPLPEKQGSDRPGSPLPPALPGPDRQRRVPQDLRDPHQGGGRYSASS